MNSITNMPTSPKWMHWLGWALTILPVLFLLMSASMKFMKPPEVTEGMTKFGWDEKLLLPLGVIEITCTILYLVPQTAVLGAIRLTGYLGGAVATHVRVGDPFYAPVLVGVVVWCGLWLREKQVRQILPLR